VIRNAFFASLLATSAAAMTIATPAQAGETERAREAIAAADAKIHTAEGLGANAELPGRTAEAKAVLEHARADFDSGHRDRAITDASHASALADNVVAELQHRQETARATAHDQAVAAQQQAADANARAATAEQSAARSAADAEAARDAAAQTAQVRTTVTTQHHGAAHKRVTKRTTTVTPSTGDQVTTTITQH
jgi:hypothetical protein